MPDPSSCDSSSQRQDSSVLSLRNEPSLADAFASCKGYLLAIAANSLEPRLKAKISTSDLLQQTYLEAHRDIHRFRGDSNGQLRAWLRRILLNNISYTRRQFHSDKRNLNRENRDFEPPALQGREKTPSSIAANHEEMELLEVAMQLLSPEHRQVIRLRNLDRKPFHVIGFEMDRSGDAARKLWFRAMKSLKTALHETRAEVLNNTKKKTPR